LISQWNTDTLTNVINSCGNEILFLSWDNCSAVTEMINHQYAVIQQDLTITFSWRLDQGHVLWIQDSEEQIVYTGSN